MRQLTHGSLFAGIGGFDLGFERAGMKTIWQVEINDYAKRVLAKQFPGTKQFGDVCGLEPPPADVLSGGFPCQDISVAGNGAGLAGERSGLWREYLRTICLVRPKFAVVENVAALLGRGMGTVLGGLAEGGYDAEWDCIPACSVGAPHQRDRVFIVSYPAMHGCDGGSNHREERQILHNEGGEPTPLQPERTRQQPEPRSMGEVLANTSCELRHGSRNTGTIGRDESANGGEDVANPTGVRQPGPRVFINPSHQEANREGQASDALDVCFRSQWATEPNVGRVAHGIPARVDRLKGLGNAIVPQIAEWIGKRIIEAAEEEEKQLGEVKE